MRCEKQNQARVKRKTIETVTLGLRSYLFLQNFQLKYQKGFNLTEEGNLLRCEELNQTYVKSKAIETIILCLTS